MSFNYVYSSGALTLVPTATQTANYTAAVNDLVIVDGTSGSPVITLPICKSNDHTLKSWGLMDSSGQVLKEFKAATGG